MNSSIVRAYVCVCVGGCYTGAGAWGVEGRLAVGARRVWHARAVDIARKCAGIRPVHAHGLTATSCAHTIYTHPATICTHTQPDGHQLWR